MKLLFYYGLIVIFLALTSFLYKTKGPYDFNKKYTVVQLRADFISLRNILEQKHPRLYEYTPKKEFDHFLDSLYRSINSKMTEREFQFFLLPVIGKAHCSHTKLMPSRYLLNHMNDYCKAPPFKLYFTADKAWLQNNYSMDTSIQPGAEVLSVNNILIGEIRKNFLARIPREGLNETFIYNRINTGIWLNTGLYGLFPGLCDYPVIDTYKLSFKNPGSTIEKQVTLAAITYKDYSSLIASDHKKEYSFYRLDSLHTAVLTVSSFLHSDEDNVFINFIDSVFTVLSSNKIQDLVVDLRGNIGGIPEGAVKLLSCLMQKEFIYYSQGNGYDEYKVPIPLAKNRFTGKVSFLADGACRSTTGHFLAMAKYYHIGPIIGEEACSSYSCNDNGEPHTLPNTKLILQCPESTYSVAVSGLKRGKGIMPDYTVIPAVGDVISGKDTVLQFALKLATSGRNF
jgi:hypothetical protein